MKVKQPSSESHNLLSKGLDGSDSYFFAVDSEIPHPSFTLGSGENNIMVVKLKGPATNFSLQAVNLDSAIPQDFSTVVASGFSRSVHDSHLPSQTNDVAASKLNHSSCLAMYPNIEISDDQLFCSSAVNHEMCYGNMGDPVVSGGAQVGIVVGGSECNTAYHPTLNVRVSSFETFFRAALCQISSFPPENCSLMDGASDTDESIAGSSLVPTISPSDGDSLQPSVDTQVSYPSALPTPGIDSSSPVAETNYVDSNETSTVIDVNSTEINTSEGFENSTGTVLANETASDASSFVTTATDGDYTNATQTEVDTSLINVTLSNNTIEDLQQDLAMSNSSNITSNVTQGDTLLNEIGTNATTSNATLETAMLSSNSTTIENSTTLDGVEVPPMNATPVDSTGIDALGNETNTTEPVLEGIQYSTADDANNDTSSVAGGESVSSTPTSYTTMSPAAAPTLTPSPVLGTQTGTPGTTVPSSSLRGSVPPSSTMTPSSSSSSPVLAMDVASGASSSPPTLAPTKSEPSMIMKAFNSILSIGGSKEDTATPTQSPMQSSAPAIPGATSMPSGKEPYVNQDDTAAGDVSPGILDSMAATASDTEAITIQGDQDESSSSDVPAGILDSMAATTSDKEAIVIQDDQDDAESSSDVPAGILESMTTTASDKEAIVIQDEQDDAESSSDSKAPIVIQDDVDQDDESSSSGDAPPPGILESMTTQKEQGPIAITDDMVATVADAVDDAIGDQNNSTATQTNNNTISISNEFSPLSDNSELMDHVMEKMGLGWWNATKTWALGVQDKFQERCPATDDCELMGMSGSRYHIEMMGTCMHLCDITKTLQVLSFACGECADDVY